MRENTRKVLTNEEFEIAVEGNKDYEHLVFSLFYLRDFVEQLTKRPKGTQVSYHFSFLNGRDIVKEGEEVSEDNTIVPFREVQLEHTSHYNVLEVRHFLRIAKMMDDTWLTKMSVMGRMLKEEYGVAVKSIPELYEIYETNKNLI